MELLVFYINDRLSCQYYVFELWGKVCEELDAHARILKFKDIVYSPKEVL